MPETLVQLVKNFVYEILLVKPADAEDSWSNNPEPSTSREWNGRSSQYWNVNLLSPKVNGNRPQKGKIQVTVFDTSDQEVRFNDILDAIRDNKNFTSDAKGNVYIKPGVLHLVGRVVGEKVPAFFGMRRNEDGIWEYTMTKKLKINFETGEETETNDKMVRNTITYFVDEFEDPIVRSEREKSRYNRFRPDDLVPNEGSADNEAEDDDMKTEKEKAEAEEQKPEGAVRKNSAGTKWLDKNNQPIDDVKK